MVAKSCYHGHIVSCPEGADVVGAIDESWSERCVDLRLVLGIQGLEIGTETGSYKVQGCFDTVPFLKSVCSCKIQIYAVVCVGGRAGW